MFRIQRAVEALREVGYEPEPLDEREFIDYIHGETTQPDIVGPEEILARELLLLHEVAEMSELKRMGTAINGKTAVEYPGPAYEAHVAAMRVELAFCRKRGDHEWLGRRVRDLESYLSDPSLPPTLAPLCRELIARYRELPESP